MNILVTGCAGFIGFHLSLALIKKNINVYGLDILNNYYDVKLKKKRLSILNKNKNFTFNKIDICNYSNLKKNFISNKYDYVIHLAAQAGVRYSISNPRTYLVNNVDGFFNIIELSKLYKVKHFLFASSSSVYGLNNTFPLTEEQNTDSPLSFYAASKKSNELFAHSFSNIYKINTTALRFFTVYGPFGRPDMALFKFTESITNKRILELFNNGNHHRDFTYIDDVVKSIIKLIKKPKRHKIPHQVINICSDKPISLKKYLSLIEQQLSIKSKIKNLKMQDGDILKTHGSSKKLSKITNYKPKTNIEDGIKHFIDWYISYHE